MPTVKSKPLLPSVVCQTVDRVHVDAWRESDDFGVPRPLLGVPPPPPAPVDVSSSKDTVSNSVAVSIAASASSASFFFGEETG